MTTGEEGTGQGLAAAPLALKLVLLVGLATGAIWVGAMFAGSTVQLFAGIIPVLSGMYVGRKISHRPIMHGFVLGLTALLTALAIVTPLVYLVPGLIPVQGDMSAADARSMTLVTVGGSALIMLLPFPIYGVFISSRTRQRKADMAAEIEKRGGRLENPGRVASVEDLQALSLAKFTTYVIRVFKKNGFKLDDFLFNKDNYCDLKMSYQDEKWLLRCIVTSDKVKPGDVQQLVQRKMKDEEIGKGVVLTSTDFIESARKWASSRPDVVVINGETLMQMSERSGTPPARS